uniref:Uncharacterized protein n=1 Tax=Salarias fasciatus TaxID=181472 RepID=A0A672F7I6_SALFA
MKFPEVPEGVVSQCVLQNNNNHRRVLPVLVPGQSRLPVRRRGEPPILRRPRLHQLRNHMTQLNLGLEPQNVHVAPARDGLRMNGSRTLAHSVTEPQSAPVRGALLPRRVRRDGAHARSQQPPQHLGLYRSASKDPPWGASRRRASTPSP